MDGLLKIAFIYGPFTLAGRTIDFTNLWDSSRGLTGSELSCICFAREMAKIGHQVSLFIQNPNSSNIDKVSIRDISNLASETAGFDAVCAWNEPDVLRPVLPGPVRIVNQQLNDFGYCKPGFDDFVDVYTSPSRSHMEYISAHTPSPHKWTVLPNGCDPNQYDPALKVPGRVIYASSPDRGLHLLLQAWPSIKRAVPNATLRVFYNMDGWISNFTPIESHYIPDFVEFGKRARYIELSMRRMSGLDITRVGSVSRKQIAREMSETMVLAYPCDTIRFTEGFSVTTMEACAAGAVPVISSVDSLGQIYGDHIPSVQSPVRDRIPEFSDLVIRGLVDSTFRDSVLSKSIKLADAHRWSVLAGTLEEIILNRRSVS